MLVLSRKVGEEIVVPQFGLVLSVQEILGGKVRIGISAPADVIVHRREVWERLQSKDGPPASVEDYVKGPAK